MGVHVANVRDTIQFALPLENDYVYTNLPAGATESGSGGAIIVDLTNYNQVNWAFQAKVGGATGSVLRLRYSLDGTTYVNLTAALNFVATGLKTSVWETIPAGARTVVMILPSASGGDGAGDPQSGPVSVQFRC